jgi:sirohydrochlorin ferrochelatase
MRPPPLSQEPFRHYQDKPGLNVVLVAHGSRDPRAAVATRALTRAVRVARPDWDVHASYLDHCLPRPAQVLSRLAPGAVVVPLLLTRAYHGRVDVPAEVAAFDVAVTDVLGPVSPLLFDALVGRLPTLDLDGVVLAAAGTRDVAARETVADAARALGDRLGLPAAVGYASAAAPTVGEAVASLPGRRVGVAAYFLAPGLLYDVAVTSALDAGAVVVAPPLSDAPALVRLVEARVEAAAARRLVAA